MRRTWWHTHRAPDSPRPIGSGVRWTSGAEISLADQDHRSELSVEPILASVAKARVAIRTSLESLSIDGAERATACGSELVANAVCHGTPPILLTVFGDADQIVVAVEDGSRRPPTPRTATAGEQSGRGTLIVDRLADQWGVDFLPHGKRVWCRIALSR